MARLDEPVPDVKAAATEPRPETLADLLDRLGSIPLDRVRMHPAPGTAVEEDVLRHLARGRTLCELVDGVLGNTEAEMERKLREYFRSGTRLVWYVDPAMRTVRVYTSPEAMTLLDEDGSLDGGDVLPGFSLSVRQWFVEAGEQAG